MEIFIAGWLSGVALAMYKIWFPSFRIIKKVDPSNPLTIRPWLSTLVVAILFTIFLPVMIFALLFDNYTENFIKAFIKGAKDE
jgi:fructose-specific phosphotransferase system IIC component